MNLRFQALSLSVCLSLSLSVSLFLSLSLLVCVIQRHTQTRSVAYSLSTDLSFNIFHTISFFLFFPYFTLKYTYTFSFSLHLSSPPLSPPFCQYLYLSLTHTHTQTHTLSLPFLSQTVSLNLIYRLWILNIFVRHSKQATLLWRCLVKNFEKIIEVCNPTLNVISSIDHIYLVFDIRAHYRTGGKASKQISASDCIPQAY